jgi:hypothetical protein
VKASKDATLRGRNTDRIFYLPGRDDRALPGVPLRSAKPLLGRRDGLHHRAPVGRREHLEGLLPGNGHHPRGVAKVIIPTTVDAPVITVAALSLWMGTCLAIALLDRSPKAYVFMLAGYTAAIIRFPTVDTQDLLSCN